MLYGISQKYELETIVVGIRDSNPANRPWMPQTDYSHEPSESLTKNFKYEKHILNVKRLWGALESN